MNIYKPLFFISLGVIISLLLYIWLKPEKVCPVCPPITTIHTVKRDTVRIESKLTPKLVATTKGKVNQLSETVWTNNVQNEKQELADMINLCSDTNTFETVSKDSIAEIKATATVTGNQLTSLVLDKKYLLPHTYDSLTLTKPVPTYRNGFTLSVFGGVSSGAALGYEYEGKEFSAGYDVINKGPVFGAKIHLGK